VAQEGEELPLEALLLVSSAESKLQWLQVSGSRKVSCMVAGGRSTPDALR
jgi:hypothetical protein